MTKKKRYKRYFVSTLTTPAKVDTVLNKWRKKHHYVFDWQIINYESSGLKIVKVWVYAEIMEKL